MRLFRDFWRWLVKQCDKLETSPGLVRTGHWRVRYSDGQYARKSTYDVACDYADMFGGEVVYTRFHDPYQREK